MISCGNTLSATDLIRLVIVDENGHPFFDCDNKWNSIRQVTVMGEDGLPALKIGEWEDKFSPQRIPNPLT